DDMVIYRFITEELVEHQMDDMRIPGMTLHYAYEEFHPNHDYDLRLGAEYFVVPIFLRTWDPDFDNYKPADKVVFSGDVYTRLETGAIIRAFQEAHGSLDMEHFEVKSVVIGPELVYADVEATI